MCCSGPARTGTLATVIRCIHQNHTLYSSQTGIRRFWKTAVASMIVTLPVSCPMTSLAPLDAHTSVFQLCSGIQYNNDLSPASQTHPSCIVRKPNFVSVDGSILPVARFQE